MTNTQKQWSKEHSPEPWSVKDTWQSGALWGTDIVSADGYYVFAAYGRSEAESKANAAHIVARVNFCAGASMERVTEGPNLVTSDADLQEQHRICVSNASDVKAFESYVHELTGHEGEDDALTVLKAFVELIRNESAELNASVEKLVADNSKLTQQAEANKEAREWLLQNANLITGALRSYFGCSPMEKLPADEELKALVLKFKALSQPSPVEAQPDLIKEITEYEKRGGKVMFWTCPKGCQGIVEWFDRIATCKTCGETSKRTVEAPVCRICGEPDKPNCALSKEAQPICQKCDAEISIPDEAQEEK